MTQIIQVLHFASGGSDFQDLRYDSTFTIFT